MKNSKPLPLSGIRVVEFTHMVMGPTCGMVLGDLGAEVDWGYAPDYVQAMGAILNASGADGLRRVATCTRSRTT